MNFSFSTRKQLDGVVGVDLDTDSVAVAAAQANEPLRAGVQPLPTGAMSGGDLTDVAAVSDALRELFGREKLTKRVRLAVASQGVAFRTIRLPLIENQEQLKAAV